MNKNSNTKTLIGRAEKVEFPTLDGLVLHARIDTGAKTSSLWATDIEESAEGLRAKIGGVEAVFEHYSRVIVSSSMGHRQVRYKVKLSIVIKQRRIKATFTLADRSGQVYPVLIGRSTLNGKFIVDVSLGSPLREEESKRSEALQAAIVEDKTV